MFTFTFILRYFGKSKVCWRIDGILGIISKIVLRFERMGGCQQPEQHATQHSIQFSSFDMSIVIFTPGQVFHLIISCLHPVDVARLDSALCVNGNRALFLSQLRLPFIALCGDKVVPSLLFCNWIIARSIKLSSVMANRVLVKHGLHVLRVSGSTLKSLIIDQNSGISRRSASALLFEVATNCRELLTLSISVRVHDTALDLLFSQCSKIRNVKLASEFTTAQDIKSVPIFLKNIHKIELTTYPASLFTLRLLTDQCPSLHALCCPNLSLTTNAQAKWFGENPSCLAELRVGYLGSAAVRLVVSKYPNLSVLHAKVGNMTESLTEVMQRLPMLHTLTLFDEEWTTINQGPGTELLVQVMEHLPLLRRLVLMSHAQRTSFTSHSPITPLTPVDSPSPPHTTPKSYSLKELHMLSFGRVDLPLLMSLCPHLNTVECTKYMPNHNLDAVPLGVRRLRLHSCLHLSSAQVGCLVHLEELLLQNNENVTDADMQRVARQSPLLRFVTVQGFVATTHKALCGFVDHCAQLVTLQYCCKHESREGCGEEGSVQGLLLQHLAKKALPRLEHCPLFRLQALPP